MPSIFLALKEDFEAYEGIHLQNTEPVNITVARPARYQVHWARFYLAKAVCDHYPPGQLLSGGTPVARS